MAWGLPTLLGQGEMMEVASRFGQVRMGSLDRASMTGRLKFGSRGEAAAFVSAVRVETSLLGPGVRVDFGIPDPNG